ncbi:DUF1824 family protein [Kovacikia minuta CCNUW1]|uniref:DUF1824 family protein n=1 Tax=Kovacikia minuta TaxID=2931930 RepID=UPI001CCB3C52|nr:DUF1824 family protein [Kovacikia minuta]UBF29252.1 DUF1824 family protein [Kovacikia minuta CCNUW1]
MPALDSDHLTLETAEKILRRFICLDSGLDSPIPERSLIQQALLLVANHSDYQIFGICADTISQAETALTAYLNALDYEDRPEISPLDGPVYVKYNPKKGKSLVEPYTGQHRGILVSCQSAYDGDVNETFGHLPLDLFE